MSSARHFASVMVIIYPLGIPAAYCSMLLAVRKEIRDGPTREGLHASHFASKLNFLWGITPVGSVGCMILQIGTKSELFMQVHMSHVSGGGKVSSFD